MSIDSFPSAKPVPGAVLQALGNLPVQRFAYPALLIAFVLFFILPLGLHGLWTPDETRYAQAAQGMLQSGDWVSPHFLGLRYFEKPIGGYWLIAISQAVFGQNLFGARFASVLVSAASALLVYVLARRLWADHLKTWTASVLFLSFGLVAGQAGYANFDPPFALWVTLSLVAAWFALEGDSTRERWTGWLLLGVACGLGFLTKGFLAWLLPVLVVLPYALCFGRWRALLVYGPVAVLVAGLVSLPWALAVHAREPDFWNFFFWNEHIRRFAGNDAQHARPFWFFVPMLFAGALPWALLVVPAFKNAWAQRRERHSAFLLFWCVLPFVFFSLSKGKLPTYILPCFVPLALMMADSLIDKLRQGQLGALRANGLLNALMGALALLALIALQVVKPVFNGESGHVALLILVFTAWALCGALQRMRPATLWFLPAVGLWLLVALLPAAMPKVVVDNKMPDQFIAQHLDELRAAHSLLSNDLGSASALAWRLNRADVTLLDGGGELQYGLAYPDAASRNVSAEHFQDWLRQQAKAGPVGMVFALAPAGRERPLPSLPGNAKVYQENNIAVVLLPQTP
ncbi:lipid IV(A) 4-amino-4-deoxy-L-arabinosyltransferase [Pseudomonas panipatensis]|uniref:Undecaprenyl phosphate-alpha-4-amino-4-deoxy-L-arabinose arabinosyl transferase n=1 Tax=Pseudomonas panipatensis TaxID=428992 RepID=A0A1G8IJ53_9PSED|nr:lipid IV(A) 4-amino-4-deoxy-L-arabinosyltransferase [Pseudomonas panipatensis]SDI18817.1 4-amino-4-deoxy-L-arabinose transferase [Pseudomonas panipatensis]SMP73829.1 4-amino-4-deoxy-L-arabinose transferase [Pseudomonas panipatensis]